MGTEMSAQVGRKQQVVILVLISSLPAGWLVLSCIQLKSEGEYMGLGGRVPIPGCGKLLRRVYGLGTVG